MKRTGFLTALLITLGLLIAPPANATATSLIIHNSEHSEAGIGIINRGSSTWNWILEPSWTANQRADPNPALDTVGYYIGPGWCAKFFVMNLAQGGSIWQFLFNVGSGYKRPAYNYNYIYGVEAHPANRGGAYGCG